jgi:hypothetical protein
MQNTEYNVVVPLIYILLASYTTGRNMSTISGHNLARYVAQSMHFIETVNLSLPTVTRNTVAWLNRLGMEDCIKI